MCIGYTEQSMVVTFFGMVVFVTAWSWPQGSDVVCHDIYGKIKLYWVAKHFLIYWVGFEFILIL